MENQDSRQLHSKMKTGKKNESARHVKFNKKLAGPRVLEGPLLTFLNSV